MPRADSDQPFRLMRRWAGNPYRVVTGVGAVVPRALPRAVSDQPFRLMRRRARSATPYLGKAENRKLEAKGWKSRLVGAESRNG